MKSRRYRCVVVVLVLYLGVTTLVRAGQYDSLLEEYRPHLYTTNKEFSPPIAVEDMLAQSYLVDTEEHRVIQDSEGRPLEPTVENLRQYDAEKYAVKLWSDYTKLHGRSKAENYEKSKPVVYARATEVSDAGVIALQYFFFYAGSYSGKLIGGLQLKWHEGDTEFAQIVLHGASKTPLGASTSIHYYGASYPWKSLLFGADGRVKMYIAQHSHATYLFPSKGLGHQAMEGNLGFGGKLVKSLRTVWDVCKEDREVDYELRIPEEDSPVFAWKGRWGGKERLHALDRGAKNHEMGPVSFAYRNALSSKLSMWERPDVFYSFYYSASTFYQKLLLSIKEVEDETVREEMFDVIYWMGRLRASVDYALDHEYVHLDAKQKAIIAEATPFVVLSMMQGTLDEVYAKGKAKLGDVTFPKLLKRIASKNIKHLMKHVDFESVEVEQVKKDPLALYHIPPDQLLGLLTKLTGLEPRTVFELYRDSHGITAGEAVAEYEFDEFAGAQE